MAKGAYGGVNDLSRKITKIYGGVGGSSRKIVKGYAGVNGVARQFWPAVNPPAEIYTFFKNGVFDHVPTGFNFTGNVENLIYTGGTDITPYIGTNKTIWWHAADYTRQWSNDGTSINSNFVYDDDIPNTNIILFPTWENTYADENRAKLEPFVNNYYLKVTGVGSFSVRLLMITGTGVYGYTTIEFISSSSEGIGENDVYFSTNTAVTKIAHIKTDTTRYIDRVQITTSQNIETNSNAWLESLELRRYIDSPGIWTGIITSFLFGYNRFEVRYNWGSPHREVITRILSNAQVYSLTWRNYRGQSSGYAMNGGELLSRAAFSVRHVVYDYHDTVISDTTAPAEQIIYNGLAFYRYRVQKSYGWYEIDDWYQRPFIDETSSKLMLEDGRLEYEFYQSIFEETIPAQVSEVSIITQ